MKIVISKESKKWLTVAEMAEVKKMIDGLKEDDIKEYAKMAANLLSGGKGTKIFLYEASAEIMRNRRVKDYFTDNSGDLDVWINFSALDDHNCFIKGGAYLSDIWQIGDVDKSSELKSRMYAEYYNLVK